MKLKIVTFFERGIYENNFKGIEIINVKWSEINNKQRYIICKELDLS